MRKILLFGSIIFISWACNRNSNSSTSSTKNSPAEDPANNVQATAPINSTEASDVKWMSYDEAVKATKKQPKKIFIDVYTDWCGWCKKMDKTTLKDPLITDYLKEKYYAVKLNAESDKTVTFQGKEITERQLAKDVFKITGYPSTVYLEADQKIIQPIPGYMDVQTLDKILHYIGENHYKDQTWEQFQMSYNK